MVLSVTLNPALDQTIRVDGIQPHDTNRVLSMATDAGGKGINLSRIVAELGGETVATGFLGGQTGDFIRRVIQRQGVRDEFLTVQGETRTNFNVESGDGPPTTFNARGAEVTAEEWHRFVAHFTGLCTGADWVALGGSLPPGLRPEVFAMLGTIAKQAGARLVLDADGEAMRAGMASHPDFIKPNVKEAERLLQRPLAGNRDAIARAARDLFDLLASGNLADPAVVISRGAEGAVLCCRQGLFEAEPIAIQARSTIGSGDSLIGGMLYALGRGHVWPEALQWGNAAGAATAMTDGSEIGRKNVIAELIEKSKVSKLNK
ncbi:MAG: 1-phosphofructokinase family hexose kinase [Armatimonadetes bacterium]|nr:1-phosphofructokinase family hexose kinase [Armatimonadota bacterium]